MAAKKNSNQPPVPIIWTSDLTAAGLSNLIESGITPTEYFIQAWEGGKQLQNFKNAPKLMEAQYMSISERVCILFDC